MRTFTRALILVLVPILVLLALCAYVYVRSPAADSALLVRTADRLWAWNGDVVQVRLHVNGDKLITAQLNEVRPAYMTVLVVDRSASMGSEPDSALETAKSAASYFARGVASPSRRVGAVAFDETSQIVHELSADGQACALAILSITSGGSTDIAAALESAAAMVRRARAGGNQGTESGLIILLSDGESPSTEAAIAAANRAKNDGVRIVTIGLGLSAGDVLLGQIASSEADFHRTMDSSMLGDVYMSIASEVSPVVGHVGSLAERYNHGAFTLERPIEGFQTQPDEALGRFEIQLPVVFAQRMELPYALRARKVGLSSLALDPAQLWFVTDPTRPDQRELIESTLAPPLLVISPLLLFWLFLPALLYALWRLLRTFLQQPAIIPEAPLAVTVGRVRPPPALDLSPARERSTRSAEATLFVGVGRAGDQVTAAIADLIDRDLYLQSEQVLPFRFLRVDSLHSTPPFAGDGRMAVEKARLPASIADEVDRIRLGGPSQDHLRWLSREVLGKAGASDLDLSGGSGGTRWASRVALYQALRGRDPAFLDAWYRALDWLKQHPSARVVLVGSLESGTGALLSDIAYLVHAALPSEQIAHFPIYAIGLADLAADHARIALNQGAFLEELDRFLLAPQLPQPMVYDPEATGDDGMFNRTMRDAVYQGFFILQAAARESNQDFISRVAALGHSLTERSLVQPLERQLIDERIYEQNYRRTNLEGVVHTASMFLLRFPVEELLDRLSCRFIMDTLSSGRLVGVALSPDGATFVPPQAPLNPLADAITLWDAMPSATPDALPIALYKAFCGTALDNQPTAVRNVLASHLLDARPPTAQELHDILGPFALDWWTRFMNGNPDLGNEATALWRAHRVFIAHAALRQLATFTEQALELERRDGIAGDEAAGTPLTRAGLIAEFLKLHTGVLQQLQRWLAALIDPSYVGIDAAASTVSAGLYRRANDRFHALSERLKREDAQPWQQVLCDDVDAPRWGENSLYDSLFNPFLKREHGLLLRWSWEFDAAVPAGAIPQLRLRLTTDSSCLYSPDDVGIDKLHKQLRDLAFSLGRTLEETTIIDRLRSTDGTLDLGPLAAALPSDEAESDALSLNRQHPGAGQRRRSTLVMMPNVEQAKMDESQVQLSRLSSSGVELVAHHDPHSIRVVVLDSVIPVRAVMLRQIVRDSDSATARLPFVFEPELTGDSMRRRIEDVLGVCPCPAFHPLTRLLAAAPMPLADWSALLAEGAFDEGFEVGRHTVVITDGQTREAVIQPYQQEPIGQVWALLNVAYGQAGQAVAARVLERWRSRPALERCALLDAAIAPFQKLVEAIQPGQPGREIMSQIALLLRLETELAHQRGARST